MKAVENHREAESSDIPNRCHRNNRYFLSVSIRKPLSTENNGADQDEPLPNDTQTMDVKPNSTLIQTVNNNRTRGREVESRDEDPASSSLRQQSGQPVKAPCYKMHLRFVQALDGLLHINMKI